MSARALRWAVLAGVAGLLAATFLMVQLREIRQAVRPSEPPMILGQVPDFALVDRSGLTVRRTDLTGAPWVADFIFTRCALSCPRLTSIMRRLGSDAPGLTRVSISVDPEHDTPEVLDDYARAYSVSDPNWKFLTGSTEAIESLVVGGFKLGLLRQPPEEVVDPDEPIVHSNRFVLVDGEGAIRGYYQVTEEAEYEKLLRDLKGLGGPMATSSDGGDQGGPAISAAAGEREIEELHAFFEDWFTGRIAATGEGYARFESVLAPDFVIIGPGGDEVGRTPILQRVESAHGSRPEGGFRIWIENTRVRECRPDRCLMTYEEWQEIDGVAKGRLSTVVFGARAGTPNGVEWMHVHETWLPETHSR